jgi:hypothetical protein
MAFQKKVDAAESFEKPDNYEYKYCRVAFDLHVIFDNYALS